jgi:hypothetical protein
MKLRVTRKAGLVLLAFLAFVMAGCVVLKVSDVRDLAHGLSLSSFVTCSAQDGSAHCRCEHRCVAEPGDCRCGDQAGGRP